ncbi:MAG: tetratricopeptide repeat protein [Acidimicrobiia bacterium]
MDDRRSPEEDRRRARPRPDRSGEDRWIDEGRVDEGRPGRMRRTSGATRSERARLPPDVADEVAMGGQAQAHRNAKRLQEAAKAYGEERYRDALRLVEPLARRLSGAAAVREVHGLCLYRLGRWKAAIAELSAAERLSGGMEHHPVIADCHRAMGQHREVDRLWEELREGTAPAAVVAEGRIVTASSLADRGDLRDAIELLEHGPVGVRRPRLHHLRLWYALAALYERAGDVARARQLFGQVRDHAPDFADVGHRYRALS